jgi:hypothetical protein
MLKWKFAALFIAGALATVGLKGLTNDSLRAEVPAVQLTSDDRADSVRRDDLVEELSVVPADDDGDLTAGNDGTSGGANTGDGDLTQGNDGTSGGANTGDGDDSGGGSNSAGGTTG